MAIDIKDNITIVDKDNNVIAIISENEMVLANGYEALYDVGAGD